MRCRPEPVCEESGGLCDPEVLQVRSTQAGVCTRRHIYILVSLDSTHLPELIGIISTLLKDRSPLSIGNVAVAFQAVCPTRLDLLHPHYRRLCRTVADVDEWGQVNLLDLLVRYARTMLARPQVTSVGPDGREVAEDDVDPDLHLLLSSSEPLLMSRNPAVRRVVCEKLLLADCVLQVVMAVTRVFFYAGPPSQLTKVVHPLLRVLQTSSEVSRVTLAYILVMCQEHSVRRYTGSVCVYRQLNICTTRRRCSRRITGTSLCAQMIQRRSKT